MDLYDDIYNTGAQSPDTTIENRDLDDAKNDDDTACSDLDLYDDLITEEGEQQMHSYKEICEKFEAAIARISLLEEENKKLRKETQQFDETQKNVEKNISSLLITARTELSRKEREIKTLRTKLGSHFFKRAGHNGYNKRFNKANKGSSESITSVDSNFEPMLVSSPVDKACIRNDNSHRMTNSKLPKTIQNYKTVEAKIELSGVSMLTVNQMKRSDKPTVEISPTRKSNSERDSDGSGRHTDQQADGISNKMKNLNGQDRENGNPDPSKNKTGSSKKSRMKDRIGSAVFPVTSRYSKNVLTEKPKDEPKYDRDRSPRESHCNNKMSLSRYKYRTRKLLVKSNAESKGSPEKSVSSDESSPELESTNCSRTLFTRRAIQKGNSSPKTSVSDKKILLLKTGYSRKKSPDSSECKRGEKAEKQSCEDRHLEKFIDSQLEKGYVTGSKDIVDSSDKFQNVGKESGTSNEKSKKTDKSDSAKQAESVRTKKVVDLREKLRLKRQLINCPDLCSSKEVANSLSGSSKRRLSNEEPLEGVKKQKLDDITDLHDCKINSDVDTMVDDKKIIQNETKESSNVAGSLSVNRKISYEKDQKKIETAVCIKEKFQARKIIYSETEPDMIKGTLTSRYRKNIDKEKESKSEVERLKRLMNEASSRVEINRQAERESQTEIPENLAENQTDKVIGKDTELNSVFTQYQNETESEIDVTIISKNSDVFHDNSKSKLPEKLEKSSEISDSSILYSNIGEVTLDSSTKSNRSSSFDAEIFQTSTADNISVATNSSFRVQTEKLIENDKNYNTDNMSLSYPAEVTSTVEENYTPEAEVVCGLTSSLENEERKLVAVNKDLVVEADTDSNIVCDVDMSKSNISSQAVDENLPSIKSDNNQGCNIEMYDKISNLYEVENSGVNKNSCGTSSIESDNLRTEISEPHDSVSDNLVDDKNLSKSCKKHKKHKKHKKGRKRNKSKSADYNSSYNKQSSESNIEDSELEISTEKDSVENGKDLIQDQSVNPCKHSSFQKSPPVSKNNSAEKSHNSCRSSNAKSDVYRGVISETISSRTSNSIDNDDFFLSPDRPLNTRRRSKEKWHSKTSSAYNNESDGSELSSNKSKKSGDGDTEHEARELKLTVRSEISTDETNNVSEESACPTTDSTEETTLSGSSSTACMSSSDGSFGSNILSEKTSSISASNLTGSSYSSNISSGSSLVSTASTSVETEENKERVSSVSEEFTNNIINDMELEIIPSASKEVVPEKSNAIEKTVTENGCNTEKGIDGKINYELNGDNKEYLTDTHVAKCNWGNHKKNCFKRRRHITDSCVTSGKIKGKKMMEEHILADSSVAFFERSSFLQCLLSEITCIVDNTHKDLTNMKTNIKKRKTATQNLSTETVRTELEADSCGMNIELCTNDAVKVSPDLAKPALTALNTVDVTKHNTNIEMKELNKAHITEHKTLQAKDLEHSASYETNEVDMMAHKTDERTYLENSVPYETPNEVDMKEHDKIKETEEQGNLHVNETNEFDPTEHTEHNKMNEIKGNADSVVNKIREVAMTDKTKDTKNLETAASCETASEVDITKHSETTERKSLKQSASCVSNEQDMADQYKTNETKQLVSSSSCETNQVDKNNQEKPGEVKGLEHLKSCITNEEDMSEFSKSTELKKRQSLKGNDNYSQDENLVVKTNEIAPEELVFGSWTGMSVATSQSHVAVSKAATSHSDITVNYHSDSSYAKDMSADSEVEMNISGSSEENENLAGNRDSFQVENAYHTNVSQNKVKIILEDNSVQTKNQSNPFFEIDEQPAFLTTVNPECKDSNLSLSSLKSSVNIEIYSSPRKNDEQSGYSADSEDNVNDTVGMEGVSKQAECEDLQVDYDNFMRKKSSPKKVAMIKRSSPAKLKANVGEKLIKEKLLFYDKNHTKTIIGYFSSPETLPRTPEKSVSADSVLSNILSRNIANNLQQLESPPKVSKIAKKQVDLSKEISYTGNDTEDAPDMLHNRKGMLMESSKSKVSSGQKLRVEKVGHKKKGPDKENKESSKDTKTTCSERKQRDIQQVSATVGNSKAVDTKENNEKKQFKQSNSRTSAENGKKSENSCVSVNKNTNQKMTGSNNDSRKSTISKCYSSNTVQKNQISDEMSPLQETLKHNTEDCQSSEVYERVSNEKLQPVVQLRRSPRKICKVANIETGNTASVSKDNNEVRRQLEQNNGVRSTSSVKTKSVLSTDSYESKFKSTAAKKTTKSLLKTPSKSATVSKPNSNNSIDDSPAKHTRSATKLNATKAAVPCAAEKLVASPDKTIPRDCSVESKCKKNLIFTKDKPASKTKLDAIAKQNNLYKQITSVTLSCSSEADKNKEHGHKTQVNCNRQLKDTNSGHSLNQDGNEMIRNPRSSHRSKKDIKTTVNESVTEEIDARKSQGHTDLHRVNRKLTSSVSKRTSSHSLNVKNANTLQKSSFEKGNEISRTKDQIKTFLSEQNSETTDSINSSGQQSEKKENYKQTKTEKNSMSLKSKTQLKETELASGSLMKTKNSKHASKLCDEKHNKMLKKKNLGTSEICDNFSVTGLNSELIEMPAVSFAQQLLQYESLLDKKSDKSAASKRSCSTQNKEKKQIQAVPHKRKDTTTVTSQNPHEVSFDNGRVVIDECKDEIGEKQNSEVNKTTQNGKFDGSNGAEVDALEKDHKTCAVADEISYSYKKDLEKQNLSTGSKSKQKFSRKDYLDSNTRKTVTEDCKANKGKQNSRKKNSEIHVKPSEDVVINSEDCSDSDSDSLTDSIIDQREANLIRSVFGSSDSSEENENSKSILFSKHVKKDTAHKGKSYTDCKTLAKSASVDKRPISKQASKRDISDDSSMHNDIHEDSSSINCCRTDTTVSNAGKMPGRHHDFDEACNTDGYSTCEKFTLSLDEQLSDSERSAHVNRSIGSKAYHSSEAFNCSHNGTYHDFSTATIRSTSGTLLLDIDDTMDNTDYNDSMLHEKSLMSNNSKSDQSFQETLSQSSNAENNQETIQSTESELLHDLNESVEEGEVTSSDDEFSENHEETDKCAAKKGCGEKESRLQKVLSPVKFPVDLRNKRQEPVKKIPDKILTKSVRISEGSKDCDSVGEKKRGQIRCEHEKLSKEKPRRERSCSYSPSRHAISHSPNVGHGQRHTRSRHNSGESMALRRRRSDSRSRNTRRSRSHSPRHRHRYQSRSLSRSPKRHYHRSRSRSRERRDYPRSRHRSPKHHQSTHKSSSRRHRSPSPVTPQRSRHRNTSNRRYKSRSPESPYLSRSSIKQHEHSHHSLSSVDKTCSHKSRQYCISEEKELCSCSCKHTPKPDREHTSKSDREHTSKSDREHTSKVDRGQCSCSKCKHNSKSDTRRLEQRHSPEFHSKYSHRHSESSYKKRKQRSCSYSDSGRSRSRSRSKDKYDHRRKRQRANLSRHCDYTSDENDSSELDRSHHD